MRSLAAVTGAHGSIHHRFFGLPRRTLPAFWAVGIVFAIRKARGKKPVGSTFNEGGTRYPFAQRKMKLISDESFDGFLVIFGKRSIRPKMKHHVFMHNHLKNFNRTPRRRKEAAHRKRVALQAGKIGVHTRKPVDVCFRWVFGEDRERVQNIFVDAHAAAGFYQFGHNGLENPAVALSPFGNQSLQFFTSHVAEFITRQSERKLTVVPTRSGARTKRYMGRSWPGMLRVQLGPTDRMESFLCVLAGHFRAVVRFFE